MIHKLVTRRLGQLKLTYRFAEDKKQGDLKEPGNIQDQIKDAKSELKKRFRGQVRMQQKYLDKTSALYDRYMSIRQKPLLCHDGLLLAYEFIIQRLPIFKPYLPKNFEVTRNRYVYAKKTGFYIELPKDLRLENGDNPFRQYDEVNQENVITHQIVLSQSEKINYRQNSRLWRHTDSNIVDPQSIQTHSSEHVYLIVKEKGKWKFPTRLISQKDAHLQMFFQMTQHLFQGTKYPMVHYPSTKPMAIRKANIDGQEKQARIMTYRGISTFGIPQFPTSIYQDFAWVPKPLLANYFQDTYFNQSVWAVTHSVY